VRIVRKASGSIDVWSNSVQKATAFRPLLSICPKKLRSNSVEVIPRKVRV